MSSRVAGNLSGGERKMLALRHADRALLIETGAICWTGTPAGLLFGDAMHTHLGV